MRDRAIELIKQINGALKAFQSGSGSVEFGGSVDGARPGEHRKRFVYPEPLVARTFMRVNITVGDEDPQAPPPPTTPERWLEVAADVEPVAQALTLFGYEHTWGNLYKVYEIIRADVGKEALERWSSRRRLGVFTQTSNSWEAAGDSARHGPGEVPAPAIPMSLAEAVNLIRGCLEHWLREKASES